MTLQVSLCRNLSERQIVGFLMQRLTFPCRAASTENLVFVCQWTVKCRSHLAAQPKIMSRDLKFGSILLRNPEPEILAEHGGSLVRQEA